MLLRLLLREEWRDLSHFETSDDPLVRAAAAISAGEPKRALAMLEAAEPGPVAGALWHLAQVRDLNWFPGGTGAAGDDDVDFARLVVPPEADEATPQSSLPAYLLVHLAAPLPARRSIIASGGGLGEQMVLDAQAVAAAVLDQEPQAIAPAAWVLADLMTRAGFVDQAVGPLDLARSMYQAVGDPSGAAACLLAEGDRAAHPWRHPELLDEDLEPRPAGPVTPLLDPETARQRYTTAEEFYAAAGSCRGAAAVGLRRARLALAADAPDEALTLLEQAGAQAEAAGDSALRMLILVQHALATIRAGGEVDGERVADRVADWASTVGSSSFARGLCRLCYVKAGRWRGDSLLHSVGALALADAVGRRIGAEAESVALDRERGALYLGANYRPAALVWTMAKIAEARATTTTTTELSVLAWGQLTELVLRAHRDAIVLTDPGVLREIADYLEWLLTRAPAETSEPALMIATAVRDALAETSVLVPLYEGVAARVGGDLGAAETWFAAAHTTAEQLGVPRLVGTVLGTMHRWDEAFALIAPHIANFPDDIAAALLIRLHQYAPALEILRRLPPPDLAREERPWEPAAREAEALLGAGQPGPAAELAGTAIAQFERHLGELSRDVLRVMATDDVTVAGLYATAVGAHTTLARPGEPGADSHRAEAFRLADRCRGASLLDLVDLSGADADGVVAEAVGGWQRAGAEFGRTVERLARSRRAGEPAVTRREMVAAERALDRAEIRMITLAPELKHRRVLPDTPTLAEIQQRLRPGTLLLEFHAFDNSLTGWAVTTDEVRMARRDAPTPELSAAVRRFHRAVADRTSAPGVRRELGRPLAELLLEPFAAELARYRRVVVVPYGSLAVLPFQVLPIGADLLITEHELSYLPSSSLLPADPGAAPPLGAGVEALVVGNPAYGPDRDLMRLPGAEVEAVTIARLRQQQVLRGAAAHRTAVLDRMATARIVHLATHGSLAEGAPYSAELALAGADSLTVPDLVGLGTTVDLAVLSACDSGRGQAGSAGDTVGLTRAFLGAGVRELIVSLWPVHDQIAGLTMVALHRELLADRPPAAALARAQREVCALSVAEANDQYRTLDLEAGPPAQRTRHIGPVRNEPVVPGIDHPFFWAPFIHVGG